MLHNQHRFFILHISCNNHTRYDHFIILLLLFFEKGKKIKYNVYSTIFLTEIWLENQAFKKRTQNKNIAKRSILNFLMCFQCFRIPFILCLGAVSKKFLSLNSL